MIPDVTLWFSFETRITGYIATKLGLLAATAMLAVNARFRVIPNLIPQTLLLTGWHIRAATLFSALFVAAGVGLNMGGYS